jgi:hypothetical protein
MTRREHKDLIDRLAPKSPSRVRCCAAQLISHFDHCHKWKEANYPTRWYYQPLADIRHDLMDAFSIHVLRQAIALLRRLEFLTVESNDRDANGRNGQDRTHRYWLHSDRIELALETLYSQPNSQPKPQNPTQSPFVNFDICNVNSDIPDFTVDTYTQIPYSVSGSASLSLKEAREEIKSLTGEEELEVSQSNSTCEEVPKDLKRDCDKKLNLGRDKFSAAPALKCVETTQDDMKPLPKLKRDCTSGFCSDTERDGFYQALLELGKSQGKKSPVAWASAIVKSINAGDPCQYLNEYREGLLVGSWEQQEWEVAPGKPYEQFVTYLKMKNKKTGMTDYEAIATAYQQLKDVNLARAQWESFKRTVNRCAEDWEKQKRIGVKSAYVPPELLPDHKVSLDEAASAMTSLQAGCIQLQVQDLAESAKLNSATASLEPAKELVIESAVTESEPVTTADADVDEEEQALELASEPAVTEPQPESEAAAVIQTLATNSVQFHELPPTTTPLPLPAAAKELESEPEPEPELNLSTVKAQAAQMREHLRSSSAMKASLGRAWVRAHEDLLIVQRDHSGQIVDFELAEEVGDGARELNREL